AIIALALGATALMASAAFAAQRYFEYHAEPDAAATAEPAVVAAVTRGAAVAAPRSGRQSNNQRLAP
ncbi:MAG: hypothetical protein ABI330_07645, partial [Caldimonas sp.]